jgi:hypothetical protein
MTLEMVHCFPGILNIVGAVGGGTTYSRILRNGAVIIDDAGYSGQQVDCRDTAAGDSDRKKGGKLVD